MTPILDSERDRRAWQWICEQVGEAAALAVDLRGRRAYVSNIAKALCLTIPRDVELPPDAVVNSMLKNMLKTLKSSRK